MSWNPPCKVKYTKVKDNSLQSSKNYFEAHKLIDKIGNILDLAKFRDAAKWLKDKANEKGFFPDALIYDINNGTKAAYNIPAFKKLDGINAKIEIDKAKYGEQKTLFQKQTMSTEGIIASEKTIRDLAARISDRIGIPYKIISDRTQEFKGKIQDNIAIINLAYATLDTPIHEILGHPIIRAIKNKNDKKAYYEINSQTDKYVIVKNQQGGSKVFNTLQEANDFIARENTTTLYQALLKELETSETGRKVFEQVKKNYNRKTENIPDWYTHIDPEKNTWLEQIQGLSEYWHSEYSQRLTRGRQFDTNEELEALLKKEQEKYNKYYTLEEQQEEAIVELLGLMTAEKLDNVKDGKLISLLKRLLKEMKQFVRSLLSQREVEIDKLPDNMTIGDLADLLAYSNSKLILPGNEVIYTTPDNQQFKTYAEASKHISDLARSVEDVDLSAVSLDIIKNNNPYNLVPDKPYYTTDSNFLVFVNSDKIKHYKDFPEYKNLEKENYYEYKFIPSKYTYEFVKVTTARVQQLVDNNPGLYIGASDELKNADLDKIGIKNFIEKNKEYEQSKEIIEEWKKVNNIQYNPEEIYSRGQEFSSVVGAYSSFDVNLMMQNLLQHIEDNEKAGGKFAISAYTKPIDRQIGHLEGGGGKIKFKIYPKSEDILWAANTDVYSGSVWDASEKVNKDKKSELLGVSYTKYPSLQNVNTVQPNLADIIDNLDHHHNELGIQLTGNNFRLEYDEDIPYQTKKIIDGINSILDQKYGKLVKPEIKEKNKREKWAAIDTGDRKSIRVFDTKEEAEKWINESKSEAEGYGLYLELGKITEKGIQPAQNNETLKESIDSVKNKIIEYEYGIEDELGMAEFTDTPDKFKSKNNKEYTSQALINTKIAALKEAAKKYPRSLIRSEVKPISVSWRLGGNLFEEDDLPFQKLSEEDKIKDLYKQAMTLSGKRIEEKLKECE